MTGDGLWVFGDEPETKLQRAEWHMKYSPRPKKTRMSKYRVKTMIIFSDSLGNLHKEFVPTGQTDNHTFYKNVLERLRERVQGVQMDISDD